MQDVPKLKPTVYVEAVPELVAQRRRRASGSPAVAAGAALRRLCLRDIFGPHVCRSPSP